MLPKTLFLTPGGEFLGLLGHQKRTRFGGSLSKNSVLEGLGRPYCAQIVICGARDALLGFVFAVGRPPGALFMLFLGALGLLVVDARADLCTPVPCSACMLCVCV